MKTVLTVWCILTIATLLAFPSGCRKKDEPDPDLQLEPVNRNLETVQMRIGSRTFALEVADTDRRREVGLMNRFSMPADHGMIFAFPTAQPRSFWMRNTRIPLDIIYVDAHGVVVSIHQMQAMDETGIPSGGRAMYAIELNKDVAATTGVKAGDKLQIPDSVVARE